MICYTQMSSYGELAKKSSATEKELEIFESIFCVVQHIILQDFLLIFKRLIYNLLRTDFIQW